VRFPLALLFFWIPLGIGVCTAFLFPLHLWMGPRWSPGILSFSSPFCCELRLYPCELPLPFKPRAPVKFYHQQVAGPHFHPNPAQSSVPLCLHGLFLDGKIFMKRMPKYVIFEFPPPPWRSPTRDSTDHTTREMLCITSSPRFATPGLQGVRPPD